MTEPAAALVVGTAGHIDHGKTSMVRVLTGVDLDAHPEEQERGITISLGFTPLDLPDGRRVAFVDVPGHERLVRTMVAGATGIGAALLCVSADDGVMPQTREHLAILDLLGVQHAVVVLTKADLVDQELLELAAEDVADLLEGTTLQGSPIVPFSAVTEHGKGELIEALGQLVDRAADNSEQRAQGPFRLPVDRAFTRPGFGTVATGTSWTGVLRDGETVKLLPVGGAARVRGIQVHGSEVKTVRPGWRAAVNLAGVDTEQVPRGTVLATGRVPCPSMIDVYYRPVPGAPPVEDGTQVRVLLGTLERLGRIYWAADVDEVEGRDPLYAQIRLEAPMPCMPGDRFVVRRVSPVDTLGGGEVVDPYTRRMRKRDRLAWGKQLARLHGGDARVWLDRAGEEGLDPADWKARGGEGGEVLGDRVFASSVMGRLSGALLEALEQYHQHNALSLGANRRELRRGRLQHLPDRVFDGLVQHLAQGGVLMADGPILRAATFEVGLTPAQQHLQDTIVERIHQAGITGLPPKELHEAFPHDDTGALLRLLELDGVVVPLAGVGWVHPSALDGIVSEVRAFFDAGNEAMSTADFKDMGGGLTRKTAIPLLEWLDKNGITRRDGDQRRRGER